LPKEFVAARIVRIRCGGADTVQIVMRVLERYAASVIDEADLTPKSGAFENESHALARGNKERPANARIAIENDWKFHCRP
jgi:hypothetical protein